LIKSAISTFALLAAFSASAIAAPAAKATLKDAQGKAVGTAVIKSAAGGVEVALNLNGLPAGDHAIHIHAVGKCEAPAFTTAGGHFNPEKKQHGMHNPQGSHAGDLENLTVPASGKLKKKVMVKGVTLEEGAGSLFHEGGTSIVIHASADDYKTDPAGNAGARIACGVIEK
jgi:Cu-Zn family superoxide dismutase